MASGRVDIMTPDLPSLAVEMQSSLKRFSGQGYFDAPDLLDQEQFEILLQAAWHEFLGLMLRQECLQPGAGGAEAFQKLNPGIIHWLSRQAVSSADGIIISTPGPVTPHSCSSCAGERRKQGIIVPPHPTNERYRLDSDAPTPSSPPGHVEEWTPSPEDDSVAQGRYTMVRELGNGGMSTVHLAFDNLLQQNVALKVMRPGLFTEPGMRDHFRRETALARELNHPNICPVFDLIETWNGCCISMKFIDGITLRELIRNHAPFCMSRIMEIARQILEALEAAHRVLVHRDLKPQNIMIDRSEQVYLLDFGLARKSFEYNEASRGIIAGTPGYMAPEQLEGKQTGPSADFYSLGVILFEMTTGHAPFSAATKDQLQHSHLWDHPLRPSGLRPGLPPEMDDLILSLLAKREEDRPQTAREVLGMIEELMLDDAKVGSGCRSS